MEEDIKILSHEEASERIKSFPGWQLKENKISKEFVFKDFMTALEFVNNLAPYFEEKDHHPDIHISYKKVTFELTRYSVGGKLTDLDFLVANEIEKRFEAQS